MTTASANCRKWRPAIRLRVCETLASEEEAQVAAHMAACFECRRYSAELHAAATGLQWLGSQEVKPSVGLRARWTSAVEDAAAPVTLSGVLEAWAEWIRSWLSRNRRPAAAIAGLWLLALLFRLSAPEAAPPGQSILAHSPTQIARVLRADQRLLAMQSWKNALPPPPQPKSKPAQPRSGLYRNPSRSFHESHLIHTLSA